MADRVLASLPSDAKDYKRALSVIVGTDKIKKRPLLAKYLSQYIGAKTMDYFIHKDLAGFLRRELDFYIKNEILHLDNLDGSDEMVSLKKHLIQIKALRKIAYHLIDFLSQLEGFQRRLWLKKKFVISTQYCITLDRIPSEFFTEIAKNQGQREEWVKLFAIDKLNGYSDPLTEKFLRDNQSLPIDTCFFSSQFKDNVVSSLDLSELDGTLICGENSQALRLLREKYSSLLSSVYIDPPYNTDGSPILYKNGYKSSSWLSLMRERLELTKDLLAKDGVICVAIDDAQFPELRRMMLDIFPYDLGVAVVRSNPAGRISRNSLPSSHEYALFFAKDAAASPSNLPPTQEQLDVYPLSDEKGRYIWNNFIRGGSGPLRTDRPTMYYPIIVKGDRLRIADMVWHKDSNGLGEYEIIEKLHPDEVPVYPKRKYGGQTVDGRWERGWKRVRAELDEYCVRRNKKGEICIEFKKRMRRETPPSTWWGRPEYASSYHGGASLRDYFGHSSCFSFPKAPRLVEDCVRTATTGKDAIILDYFAGSGTTPDIVIHLNRCDGGHRKYIAVEMGAHFADVMLPRMKKVIYCPNWKNGEPDLSQLENGSKLAGQAFKYLHLESYEDTLNNLVLQPSIKIKEGSDSDSSYLLNYFLKIETKGSASLLNINSFDEPEEYKLNIKKQGGFERTDHRVDLIETFNYMIGMHVNHVGIWHRFDCKFKRIEDAELPDQRAAKMVIDGQPKKASNGRWGFRNIQGHILSVPGEHSSREPTLIIWRTLSEDLEKDNLLLDEWFTKCCMSLENFASIRTIYINGSNNLSRFLPKNSSKAVCLIEEAFHRSMWELKDG